MIMLLRPFQEIFGNLKSITDDEHQIKIKLTFDLEIDIPNDPVSLERLKALTGKRIGIINIDGKYRIRELISTSKPYSVETMQNKNSD